MTRIRCEHCKATIEGCPTCSEEIEQSLTFPVIFLIIALFAVLLTGYRWHSSLSEHENAMQLRRTYLKSNPDALKLPSSL